VELTGKIYSEGGAKFAQITAPLDQIDVGGQTPVRRVILSTNVAETSVTIETLRYCVDTGFRKAAEYYPNGVNTLMMKPVTQSQATQRAGRVGRVAEGVFWGLYQEKTFNALMPNTLPDLVTADITRAVLGVMVASGWSAKVDMMDNPPNSALWNALERLYAIGAITAVKGEVVPTELGILMNKFRMLPLEGIRAILSAYHWGASVLDMITIVCCISVGRITGRKYKMRKPWKDDRGTWLLADRHIDYLLLYEQFREVAEQKPAELRAWCADENVDYEFMLIMIERRDDTIADMIGVIGFDPLWMGGDIPTVEYSLTGVLSQPDIAYDYIRAIKRCLYDGYRASLLIWNEDHYSYRGLKVQCPPDLECRTPPRFLLASGLSMRDRPMITVEAWSVLDGAFDVDYSAI
jgi:HrpA-like RNA helicase